jgi:hypothetical protein
MLFSSIIHAGEVGAVESAPIGGGAVTVIAPGINPEALTIDEANVYWTDRGEETYYPPYYEEEAGIYAAPLTGTADGGAAAPTLLASSSLPVAIAIDSSYVYWTNINYSRTGGAILRVPKAGGTAATLVSGSILPSGLAVDGTSIYWVDDIAGGPMKAPKSGGAAVTLATGYPGTLIGIDATSLYWTVATRTTPQTGAVMQITPK